MRTLKYAILGLLNQKDMTGYDLMKQFESTLCEFWSAQHSQIYPELHKLTEEGSIRYETLISGTNLEKKQYSITDKGRQDFLKWLSAETQMPVTPKDVSRLKIFFCSCLPEDKRLYLLSDQLRQHKLRLEHLKRNQEKFTSVPSKEDDAFGDYLVLMGAIMREEMNCSWLEKCMELL